MNWPLFLPNDQQSAAPQLLLTINGRPRITGCITPQGAGAAQNVRAAELSF
jgi:hypothetical protein